MKTKKISAFPFPPSSEVSIGISEQQKKTLSGVLREAQWQDFQSDNAGLIEKRGVGILYEGSAGKPENFAAEDLQFKTPYPRFKPSRRLRASRETFDGFKIYDSIYSIDELSRRKTPPLQKKDQSQNILLLGCSYTFGTGLQDNQTFAAFLSQKQARSRVLNFGIYGAGANDILDDLLRAEDSRFKDIKPTAGYTIYTALYDHLERSTCTLKCLKPTYKSWVFDKSNYIVDEKFQRPIRVGSFQESRPYLNKFYEILSLSSVLEYFHINIPPRYTDRQIENYVLLIKEMERITTEKFKTEFYFTFYPGTYFEWPRIQFFLKKHNIKYFDFSMIDFSSLTQNRQNIVFDGHPTVLSNVLYAELLNQALKP